MKPITMKHDWSRDPKIFPKNAHASAMLFHRKYMKSSADRCKMAPYEILLISIYNIQYKCC